VVDSLIREELLRLGFPEERIAVVGSPRFELLRKKKVDGGNIREELGISADDFLIAFVSQPIERLLGSVETWGFSEKTVLRALREAITILEEATTRKLFLIVMLHPEEDGAEMEKIIREKDGKLRYRLLREGNDSLDIIAAADLVAGMFSILLTEAVIMRKPVLSLQLDLKQPDMLVTNMVGATVPVRNKADLGKWLLNMVQDAGFRAKLLERQKCFEVVEDSLDRWMALISDLMTSQRA
jgi:UDP-N-acetylglucosamine 2-epimerase